MKVVAVGDHGTAGSPQELTGRHSAKLTPVITTVLY